MGTVGEVFNEWGFLLWRRFRKTQTLLAVVGVGGEKNL
jgi:hypothetical protein